MSRAKSIVYVNYSPNENAGKILDYLLDNYRYVFLFSVGFYLLRNKRHFNKLVIYHNGKKEKDHLLHQFPMHQKFFFILLPIRSIITFLQIIYHTFRLAKHYGRIDYYFTVNAFTAWTGNILKGFSVVNKTIFWVWDYYPPIHKDKMITLMRMIYWQFDKISSYSDRVFFVNNRLINLRKEIGVLDRQVAYPIVPIGTESLTHITNRTLSGPIVLCFFGVLRKSQGLDLILDNSKKIIKRFPRIKLEVIGSGPEEDYFKSKASQSSMQVSFHGYLDDSSTDLILKNCHIGIATYAPDKSNVSRFGDPGKIKRYLSLSLPVITTDIFEFASELRASGAGMIIDYSKPKEFVNAITKISTNYKFYSKNARQLSSKYNYKKLYPKLFTA